MTEVNELKVPEKKVTVFETAIIDRMIADIREADADMLVTFIEFFYPVKAEYEDGYVTIEVDEEQGFKKLDEVF